MSRMQPLPDQPKENRLASLDLLRGVIMVLLMMESTGMYERLNELCEGTAAVDVMQQFFHHPWHGLRFWDMIQPGFMFLAGTALALSLARQRQQGVPWEYSLFKVMKRCGWLFFLGVLNYAVRRTGLSFELWNVLTQLSFTYLLTFLIFSWSAGRQILVCFCLLVLTEILYRFTGVPGFDQPFTDQHNFGNYMDLVLMGKINPDGWVAINCLPTACHTIAGALAGKLLISETSTSGKLKILFYPGIMLVLAGYGMDLALTPIIKRIATTSFTVVTMGWCLLALALFYWWVDVRLHRRRLLFFTVVSMNSILIYLFFEIVGSRWFNGYIDAITFGSLGKVLPLALTGLISSALIFTLEWSLCWFLYKKNIIIKI